MALMQSPLLTRNSKTLPFGLLHHGCLNHSAPSHTSIDHRVPHLCQDPFEKHYIMSSSSQNPPQVAAKRTPEKDSRAQPHSLTEFQQREGLENRKRRLHDLWQNISHPPSPKTSLQTSHDANDHSVTPESAVSLKAMYDHELVGRCKSDPSSSRPSPISWEEFQTYADAKEAGGFRSYFIVYLPTQTKPSFQNSGIYSTMT